MYDNLGEKIMGLAKACFWIEAIATIIAGIAIFAETNKGWSLLLLLVGPLAAWVSSWLLYGFGELISSQKNTEYLVRYAIANKEIKTDETARRKVVNVDGPHVMVNKFNEGICSSCHKSVTTSTSYGTEKCPHCGVWLKVIQ